MLMPRWLAKIIITLGVVMLLLGMIADSGFIPVAIFLVAVTTIGLLIWAIVSLIGNGKS